jgi:hypothetical protein
MSPDETLADALSRDADDPADDAYAGDAVDDADRQAPAPLGPVIDRRDPRVALAVAGIAAAAVLVGGLVALVIGLAR